MHAIRLRRAFLLLASVMMMAIPRVSSAQSTDKTRGSRWEIDFHVGYGKAGEPREGSGQLPPMGPVFTTSTPATGRYVPSWFLGDGASILNANNAFSFLAGRVVPLDMVLTSSSGIVGRGVALGGRATRQLSSTFAVEGTVDLIQHPVRLVDWARAGAVQSETTFGAAMDQLLSLQSESRSVSASVTIRETGVRVMAGADLRCRLSHTPSFRTYVFGGGGFVAQVGTPLTVTLVGDYQFVRLGVPFHETDTVTVKYRSSSSFFVRVGGGASKDLGRRYGIRGDLAFILEPSRLAISVDTTPSRVIGTPQGVGVAPAPSSHSIRFSTVDGTVSSLSTALVGFETFAGSGWRTNVVATGGVFLKF